MKANLELEIYRSIGGTENRLMSVYITDQKSHCRILEVSFGLAEFMDILTGRGGLSAEGELYLDNPLGCTPEHKEELLPRPQKYNDEKEAAKLIKPFEVDGWRARPEDLHNHHRWAGENQVQVTFSRFIRPDGSVWESSE
jgi:hypothetical protein